MLNDQAFVSVVTQAAEECRHPLEEEGGVIFERDGEYCFLKVNNTHQGTDTAIGLYEADKEELGKGMFEKYQEGWKMFSSFHTHPTFAPYPSSIDLNTLFQGFEHNVIYAPKYNKAFSYSTWENGVSRVKQIITLQ